MLAMEPLRKMEPLSLKRGSAFCTVKSVPRTLRSKVLSKCSSVTSSSLASSPCPALAKRISISPFSRFTVSYRRSRSARLLASPCTPVTFLPMSLTASSSLSFDRDEGGTINAGEVQWMTAGSGIIHSEDVRTKGKVRLLQLWLTLPKNKRWIAPDFQTINVNEVPMRRENGAEIRVYSGSSVGLQSGTRNHVSVTMVEINLEPNAKAELDMPASYNGFAFVIDGSVRIGDTELNTGQVGWLDRPTDSGMSVLRVVAGESGARLVSYAGQPQGDPIVS